ncbi:hypothetical protein [Paenibacillus agilis]|uniref:Uncharacterized protein n=1 Tax=Paenibacillus agilis TaxID=3020863 RepID=A0A559ID94_9BACL|nr:hypothetical protein [Paenibacillus agilis]TVX85641.1 hypothetical protein FPZ44_25155 [Paenibacillus agilis]
MNKEQVAKLLTKAHQNYLLGIYFINDTCVIIDFTQDDAFKGYRSAAARTKNENLLGCVNLKKPVFECKWSDGEHLCSLVTNNIKDLINKLSPTEILSFESLIVKARPKKRMPIKRRRAQ